MPKKVYSFQAKEYFEYDKLKKIMDNWNDKRIPNEVRETYSIGKKHIMPKVVLNQYLIKAKKINDKIGCVQVKYKYAKNKTNGRQFVIKGLGLQSFSKWIRHTIAGNIYNDIDMKNAQPTILMQYCKKHDYPCKYLRRSVKHNEEYLESIMKRYGLERQDAKQKKHSVMYGSDETINVKWFTNYKKEMIEIHKLIMRDNVDIVHEIEKTNEEQKNINGKVCSQILCKIEDEMLCACIEFLKKEKISVKNIILTFDGFMIRKEIFNPTKEILEKMSEYVYEKTGYKADYVNKPQEHIIDLSDLKIKEDDEENIIEDDAEACEHLLKKMGDRIVSCNGTIFVKTTDTRIWSNREYDVVREINNECISLGLMKMTKVGTVPYSRNVSNMRNMAILIRTMCKRDDEFMETLRIKSKDKIFFNDCVYDFKMGKYREETEEDMTPIRILRQHPNNVKKEKVKEVIDVINSICEKDYETYGELSPTSKNFIQHVGRAIAGHLEDKDWVVGLGLRNSGKGMLTSVCNNAFGEYVKSVDANNFISKPKSGDEAIMKMWLNKCIWARIVITNEIDDKKENMENAVLNGILIKSLASGGDIQTIRTLYKDEMNFVFGGRIFLFFNDMPTVRPIDTCQTMTMFEFPNQYIKPDIYDQMKENGELEVYMRRGDPELIMKIKEEEFCDAFVQIVLENYEKKGVINTKEIQQACSEYRIESGDELLYFKERFDFSDKKAVMSSADILDEIHAKYPKISAQKVKTYLTKNMGLKNKRVDNVRCYCGIKLKE
jgi:hypothetical protein